MKILIIRLSAIGDIFHTFTILPDIRKVFKDVQIDWLVDESFVEVAKLSPLIDNVIPIPLKKWKKSKLSYLPNLIKYKKSLPKVNYDYIIDTQSLIKTAVLSKFLFNGDIYGLDRNSAREPLASLFYDYKYNINQDNIAVIRLRGLIAKIFNLNHNLREFNFEVKPKPYLPNFDSKYILFLHGTSKENKKWAIDNWVDLSLWIISNTDKQIVVTHSNDSEYQFTQDLKDKLNSSRLTVIDKLKFAEFVDVVKHASLVVGVDTGFTHLANLLHIPTIAIYQASDPNYVGMLESDIAKNLGNKESKVTSPQVISCIQRILLEQ
ncbi:MAG: lipopolysaccharide heptosyltransferase I [Neisseriaceae bacterium]|nr:MAG: lipopolysaccharide heptosyltransferase I [Neisseriaceae bacterium]